MDILRPANNQTIEIKYNDIIYRFSRESFEGTNASPVFAEVLFPDGREVIYPMWNQGKQRFRYLRRNGCSTCALTCVLAAFADPSLTPGKVLLSRRKILTFSPRAVCKPITIAAIILMLRQHHLALDYIDGGSDDAVRSFILTNAKAGIPVIATGTNIPSLRGANLANKAIHTFVVIGMKDDRTLITLDSSGYNDQRVKFVDIDSMVRGVLKSGIEYGLANRQHFYAKGTGGGLIALK